MPLVKLKFAVRSPATNWSFSTIFVRFVGKSPRVEGGPMRRVQTSVFAVALGLAFVAAACGGSSTQKASSGSGSTTTVSGAVDPNAPEVVAPGDIPDTQVFVSFAGPGGRYSLKVPEGWARSTVGTTVTLTDHYNTIRATINPVRVAPTASEAKATEVPLLRRTVSNFELVKIDAVNRTAGRAVLVSYRAGSAPDPVTGKRVAIDVERYEFWRSGTQVTLTLSGARGSDNVDPWKTITDSFAWKS